MPNAQESVNPPVHLTAADDRRLIENGYSPIPISMPDPANDNAGKAPFVQGWRDGDITVERLVAMRQAHPDHPGTGIRTDNVIGIDIDIVDVELAKAFADLVEQVLGDSPLIRRGSKGFLAVYGVDSTIGKISIAPVDKEKAKFARVEILGNGQQFVAYGIHPKTGQPYRWLGKDPDLGDVLHPLNVPATSLPCVTIDNLRDLARQTATLLTAHGLGECRITGDTGEDRAVPAAGRPVAEKALRAALKVLDPFTDRDTWRNMVCAIASASIIGDDSLHSKARAIAHEWSRGELGDLPDDPVHPKYTGPLAVDTVFDSMSAKAGGITIATLFGAAQEAGWQGNPYDDGKSPAETFANIKLSAVESIEPGLVFPDVGNNGALKPTTANARVALRAIGLQCRHDVFHDRLMVGGRVLDQWVGPVNDEIVARLCHMTYEGFHFEPDPKKMQLAIQQLCFENKFNPVVDYLAGLTWDGVKRIDSWLIEAVGAPDTPYVRAVSRIVLVAAVRRARQPGCKFDEIVVLEGREGLNKSSLIELMAGSENFSDQSILAADDRKQQEQMAGVWLYEIADLTGIRKAEVEKIKAFASRQEDRCRPAYGHFLKSQKRQCVLIATTNDTDFLQSQTGNRRWWPIAVTKACDLKALAAVRDQLWAEAAALEAAGESIRLPKELWSAAGEEQEKRRLAHPWEDILARIVGEKYAIPGCDDQHEERILSSDVFSRYLRMDPSVQNGWHGKTVRQIMTRLDWEYRCGIRIGSRASGGYVRIVEGPLPAAPREESGADKMEDELFGDIAAR